MVEKSIHLNLNLLRDSKMNRYSEKAPVYLSSCECINLNIMKQSSVGSMQSNRANGLAVTSN